MQNVANPGLVRPPVVYTLAVVAGLALEAVWPVGLPLGRAGPLLAGVFGVVAVLLVVWTRRVFKAANTPVPGNRPAVAVVTSGPFRLSRNPLYLAFTALGLSVAVFAGSAWAVGTVVLAMGVMQWVVIPREERYMAQRFGDEYVAYMSSVRRWL